MTDWSTHLAWPKPLRTRKSDDATAWHIPFLGSMHICALSDEAIRVQRVMEEIKEHSKKR